MKIDWLPKLAASDKLPRLEDRGFRDWSWDQKFGRG